METRDNKVKKLYKTKPERVIWSLIERIERRCCHRVIKCKSVLRCYTVYSQVVVYKRRINLILVYIICV